MQRIAIASLLLTGCLSLGPKREPSTRAQIIAGVSGAAIAAAAVTGAALAHDAPIAQQTAATMASSVIPMAAIYLGEEPDDEPSTPGGIYSSLGRGIGSAFGASLSFGAPLLATYLAGDETERSDGAMWGATLGVIAGSAAAVTLGNHLPKWARVVVGAVVVGATTTLGYQLGGGGPPR